MVGGDSIGSHRNRSHPATKHLAAYLNDHMAGSVAGLELVRYLENGDFGARVVEVATTLRRDIAADRQLLAELMRQVGAEENHQRQATVWLGEKLAELKARWDDPTDGSLRLLEIAEALALGIDGKEALWQALASLPAGDPPLTADFARLVQRARDQRRRIETIRVMAARSALSKARPGATIRQSRRWTASRRARRTVGLLGSVIGATLIVAAARRPVSAKR
jgi:hypothetical protein